MQKLLILALLPALLIWQGLWAAPGGEGARRPGSVRELSIVIGRLPTGPLNAITDVPGVLVGHRTIIRGDNIRTGVTAVLPHGGNLFHEKVEGAVVVYNGFGKLAGSTQVNELGQIETPILLTNTLSVPKAADALIAYMLALPGMEKVASINPLVAETNDHYLNDIRSRPVEKEDVAAAIGNARPGPVELGSVGAGTGTRCFGYKGGIGSSSRVVETGDSTYTVGVLVQTNFGGILTVDGVRLGMKENPGSGAYTAEHGGSCIIVIATDAPLGHRNLRRLARRSFAGMARVGSDFSNGSGDYAIAFTTHPDFREIRGEGGTLLKARSPLKNGPASRLFAACIEATEEAILSSMVAATTVTGRNGHRVEAIDIDKLKAALEGRR
ncbi:MAG: P1 family peptidase [Gemmatimonadota bacterium]|nr:P1 family peptidase [Gemmatimonadota bacterium]